MASSTQEDEFLGKFTAKRQKKRKAKKERKKKRKERKKREEKRKLRVPGHVHLLSANARTRLEEDQSVLV